MVFDCAESNGDNGEVVRRRDGAAGVLRGVVEGSPAPHDPIFMCRYSFRCFILTLNRLVTIASRFDDALVLKAYFEVSSRGPRLPMTLFVCVDTRFTVLS